VGGCCGRNELYALGDEGEGGRGAWVGGAVKMSSTLWEMRDSRMVSPGMPLLARFWMERFVDRVDCSTCVECGIVTQSLTQ